MLLSVITPTLNRAATLSDALDSVRMASSKIDIEHIVVDGGSSDGTKELLAARPEVTVITGPDRNLYEAINKGIQASRGDVIGLLNSDDAYVPAGLLAAIHVLAESNAAASVCGGAEFVSEDGTLARAQDDNRLKRMRMQDVICDGPIINARLFRRSVFDQIGMFDVRFAVASDREFLMRVYQARLPRVSVPDRVYRYGCHAGSLTLGTAASRRRYLKENFEASRARLRETGRNHRAYRYWHAWAGAYLAIELLKSGRFREAGSLVASMYADDFAWPAFAGPLMAARILDRVRTIPGKLST